MDSIDRQGEASRQLRVAIIQPGSRDNLLPSLRQLTYDRNEDVDLVVWGEASVGCFPADLGSFRSAARDAATADAAEPAPCPGLDRPLLCAGSTFLPGANADQPLLNTAFLIDRNEAVLGRYHKRALMPWGEYAIGQQWLPGMCNLLGDNAAWTPGTSAAPLRLPHHSQLGVLICYDDVQAQPARETVLEGADVLINLNNLNVFGRSAALKQHQHLARFRAIENRRCLVRCGITGSSAVISPNGRVLHQLPTNAPATMVANVRLFDSVSIYTHFGDVFAIVCISVCSLLLCIKSIARLTVKSVATRARRRKFSPWTASFAISRQG